LIFDLFSYFDKPVSNVTRCVNNYDDQHDVRAYMYNYMHA